MAKEMAKLGGVKATGEAEETKTATRAAKEEETKTATRAAKEEETKTEETKTAEKKAVKETTRARKTTTRTAKKAEKVELKPEVYIQYQEKEAVVAEAVDKAKAEYVAAGHRVSSIKTLQIYLKPEEGAAYYVINQKVAGRVDLF